jgi:uracil-DNA glycosylase
VTGVHPVTDAPASATLDELGAVAKGCTACADLVASRSTVVVGDFPPGARVLLVGEAPGAQEDEAGAPFVGRSGQLLDALLTEAGLPREAVAVTNVLKCRPPGNRKPRRREVETCRPWLTRQVALAAPAVLCTLGGTALEWARGPGARIVSLRGRVHEHLGVPLVATYHPSAAIRFGPAGAPMAALREDLALVARLAEGLPG